MISEGKIKEIDLHNKSSSEAKYEQMISSYIHKAEKVSNSHLINQS